MATTFVTGTNQANLASNITSAITSGFLDLTIYSVSTAIIGSNLDDLIPNISSLQALRFSDVPDLPFEAFRQASFTNLKVISGTLPIITNTSAFSQIVMNNLSDIDLPNLTSFAGDSTFQATMNNLRRLNLPSLTTINGASTFRNSKINALTTMNLLGLTSISGNSSFRDAEINALTAFNWPANLPSFPVNTFDGLSVSKLPGICLGKVTTFDGTTFQNISDGPNDMKVLGGKTQANLVYASDFYGYACPPLIFNIPVGGSASVFSGYAYKDFGGTTASGLAITHVNELPTPVTIGGMTFQSNGTITVNSDVPNTTFSMRFSATGSLIGARSVKVKPCFFNVSDVSAKKTALVDRKTGLGTFFLQVSGYQTWNRTGTRKINGTFKDIPASSDLSSNGIFTLNFSTSDFSSDIIPLSCSASNGTCVSTFTSNYSAIPTSLTSRLQMRLIGSLFDFQLTLPSDYNPQGSDSGSFFSDICAFAQTKPFNLIPALFETLENSDMFVSDAIITTGIHNVFVSCSSQCLNINEISDSFALKICSFTSDAKITYSDNNPAHAVSDKPTLIDSITTEITESVPLTVIEIASAMPCSNILSDVQFSALSFNHFQITGYQLDDQTETRTISASYFDAPTLTQSFSSDSFFSFDFTNTQISDGALVNLIAQGPNCKAITSTIATSFAALSDVEFFAFSPNQFKITGYQFYSKPILRTVSASDQVQTFNQDGFFQFIFSNTPIVDGLPITVTVTASDSPTLTASVTSQSQIIAQGTLNAQYTGSLLNFNLALPPELAITLPISADVHEIFSDMCAFAATKDCNSFLAGILINDFSDLFCSDAVIVQHPEVVVVSCSDNVLHLDDDDGLFAFSITNFMSDSVFMEYADAFCQISDTMSLIGGSFTFQTSDTNFVWVTPCSSDAPNTFTNVFSHPLLAIDAQGDIVDIGLIDCTCPCHNPTSDLLYVSQIKAATLKLGQYLSDHYSDYTSKISDRCHVLYLGGITAGVVTVDIDAVQLIFSNLSIPFSDVEVC